MSTGRIKIKLAELMAVRLFASKDKSRYILNSVHIEAERSTAILVATNGVAMATVLSRLEDEETTEPFTATIASDALDAIAKRCHQTATIEITTMMDMEKGLKVALLKVGQGNDTVEVRCALLTSNYPDWRKVLPTEGPMPATRATLNPHLMERFVKAGKLLAKDRAVTLVLRGEGGVMQVNIEGVPNFFGLWMPMNRKEESGGEGVPSWLAKEAAGDWFVEKPEPLVMEPDGPKWGKAVELALWSDGGIDSKLVVAELNTNGRAMWYASLALGVGGVSLLETATEGERCAKQRYDAIRAAERRAKSWLVQKLGKETAAGFYEKLRAVVESQKEIAE